MYCEVEFVPVGEASKAGDAIVLRYGGETDYELMIIDGGNLDSGQALVDHVCANYGNHAISHVLLTHADADHSSGLRTVLSELDVSNLWLHIPWLDVAAIRPYFTDKRWTDEGLRNRMMKDYDIITDLLTTTYTKNISVRLPFAGARIGPFMVLSPSRDVYNLLVPQFDLTPDADQEALEATGYWIGKDIRPGSIMAMFKQAVDKAQNWIVDHWSGEQLRDGGVTTASNESSTVLYGDMPGNRILLTGDAGIRALSMAADFADASGLALREFAFVQIPHHGSRRNVGPTVLNRILGPILPEGTSGSFEAFVSCPKDDEKHPRKIVLNSFTKRGGRVQATQGVKKVHLGGFALRPGYTSVEPMPFISRVEDYD